MDYKDPEIHWGGDIVIAGAYRYQYKHPGWALHQWLVSKPQKFTPEFSERGKMIMEMEMEMIKTRVGDILLNR